jgi:hypothetical protein
MEKKYIKGKRTLFWLLLISVILLFTFSVSAQVYPDGCFNQYGVERTSADSNDNDFCYDSMGNLTAVTFLEYQANQAFSGNLNGNPFGQGNGQVVLQLPTAIPTAVPSESPSQKTIMMSVPIIGTVTEIIGKYPAQGQVYQTTDIAFVWSFDSAGVDTVTTSFTLYIDGVGYPVYPTCDVSSCQTTRSVPVGYHYWYVTAQAGTWSVSSSVIYFSVTAPASAAPAKPILQSPSGTIQSQQTQMVWLPAENATSYTVNWTGPVSGSKSLIGTDESCQNGYCSLAVDSLALGNYSWTVTAYNSTSGLSETSDPMVFTVAAPTSKPGKPILEEPNDTYTSSSVNFIWKPVSDATTYTVYWTSQWGQTGSKTLAAGDVSCMSGDCHVSDIMPAIGSYSWYVIATNSAGSTQSDPMYFTIHLGVTAPTGVSPVGTVNNSQPFNYTFTAVEDNTYEYNVRVFNVYTNAQAADYYWNVSDLNCSGGYCTGTANSTLPSGYYYWKVRARSNNDVSEWSAPVYFNNSYCYNCNQPGYQPNTVPTPYSPVGIIQTPVPVFSWKPITGATAYWLRIYNAAGTMIYSGLTDNSVCDYQTCTYSPNFTLPGNGNYSWEIIGGSNAGVAWNNAYATFTYQGQPIKIVPAKEPAEIRFVYPAEGGKLYTGEAQIIWVDPFETVSSYKVTISDTNGQHLLDAVLDRKSAWCDEKTCTIEFAQIPLNQLYKIEITPVGKSGKEGKKASLNFSVTDQPLEFEALYPMQNQKADRQPFFSWRLPSGTPEDQQRKYTYAIRLIDKTRNRESVLGPFTCESDGMVCFKGGAFFTLSAPLEAGQYQWGVQVKELQKVSAALTFVIE